MQLCVPFRIFRLDADVLCERRSSIGPVVPRETRHVTMLGARARETYIVPCHFGRSSVLQKGGCGRVEVEAILKLTGLSAMFAELVRVSSVSRDACGWTGARPA
jgi:hypothetical protein